MCLYLQVAVKTGSGYCGSVMRSHVQVGWQGELVALCELRHAANKYSWTELENVVRYLNKRPDLQQQLQKHHQETLMEKAYVVMCHCAYMFKVATQLLGLGIRKSSRGSGTSLSKTRSWKLLEDACRLGLCPKVLLPNIHEWVELSKAACCLFGKARKLRTGVEKTSRLRSKAQRLGYRSGKNYSQVQLLDKVRNGPKQQRLRWTDWEKLCRHMGIDPNPRDDDGGRTKLKIAEMRRGTLEKPTLNGIKDICSRGNIRTIGKRKHELISDVLKVEDLI
jgi:hypothetical protein